MRFLVMILLLGLCDISYGQAVWKGREYSSPVCNNPNCQMCNSIRSQLTPTMTSQPLQYRTEYRTVSKQVRRCDGRNCWYETVTELVAVQVPITSNVSLRSNVPLGSSAYESRAQQQSDISQSLDKVDKLVPTPEDATSVALELLALTPTDVLFEPGCGDGRLLSKATCLAMGIELNPETASKARTNAPNAIVLTGDAATYDYSQATVVYMYLYPDLMNKIIPLLKPGTRIVSYCHSVPGIEWKQHTVKGHTFYTGTK